MKKLERLFYIFSFASFLFMTLSCSNLMNPAGINKDTDDTKLYTVTGRVEFSGAVPQEMADALLNNADNSNGAKNAVPVGLSYSRKVNYREKNSDNWDDIPLNNGTFVISLPAGDYELKAVVAASQTGEELFEILESDVYSLSIGAQNKKYNPVLTLKPVTEGQNGFINLKIKKTEAYDYLIAIFDDNAEQKMEYDPIGGDYYYLNGGYIRNSEPSSLNSVPCGIHKLDLYFYNNNDQLVYYCHEMINVFNQLTTDGWSGGGHIYNRNSENRIEITPALVAEFAMSNVYVDEKSNVQAAVGTYQEPFHNLKDAIDYINRSAAAFDAAGGTDPAPEYTIWLKSDVTIPLSQSDGYVFDTLAPTGKASKNLTIRSSGDNVKRKIDSKNVGNENSTFTLQGNYYNFNFKDLIFTDNGKVILTNQTITVDNCSFESMKSGITDPKVIYISSPDPALQPVELILGGQTTFAANAPIYLDGNTMIVLNSDANKCTPFTCDENFKANIKIAQAQDYDSLSNVYVKLSDDIIKDETRKCVDKFKIINYWYDIDVYNDQGIDRGKIIPHMYVTAALSGSSGSSGNGSSTAPFTLDKAIENYKIIKSNLTSAVPVTITLEKGEYVLDDDILSETLFETVNPGTNLTIEGAGKRTGNDGTKITVEDNEDNTYGLVNFKNINSKFTLKNITINGNDKRFNSNAFSFKNGKSAVFENVKIINFDMGTNSHVLYSEIPLSLNDCTFKDCRMYDTEGFLSRENSAIYYAGPVDGFTISGNNQINENYIVDDFTNPSKQNPANIHLAKSGSPAVQTYFTVTGSLTGSSIGVNTATAPTRAEPVVFTSGYFSKGNKINVLRSIFTGDSASVSASANNEEGVLVTGGGTAKGDAIADNIKFELSHYVIDLSQGDYSSGYPAISFTAKCDGTDITNKLTNCKMTVSSHTRELKSESGKSITFNSSWYPDDYEITVEADYNKNGITKSYSAAFYVPIIKSDDLTYMSDDEPPTSGIYKIGTVAAINKIRTWTQSGDLPAGVTFELTNDIELPASFTSIGTATTTTTTSSSKRFKANFNGNGHSLILNGVANCGSVFGYVQGAGSSNKSIIQNLTIKSKDNIIKSSSFYVFASNIYYCEIKNCVNECNVTVTGTGTLLQASGFVGSMGNYTVIKNCVNKGDITADITAAGFSSSTGSYSTISNCRNYGTITAKGSKTFLNATVSAAGISLAVGGYQNNYIVNCCNTGDVTGPKICGGIVAVGQTQAEQGIFNCYNSGNITSTDSSAGGIAGCYSYNVNYKFLTIKNCCNYGNITGEEKGAVIGNIGDGGTISYANDFYLDGTALSGAYDSTDNLTGINKKTLTEFGNSTDGPIATLNNGDSAGEISFETWIIGPQGYPVLKF